MNNVYTLTLNSAIEEVIFAEGVDCSRPLRIKDSHEYLTGKAVNTGMVLTNLQIPCKMKIVCGTDTADCYRRLGNGFRKIDVLPVVGVTRRNQTIVFDDGNEHKIINKGYMVTEEQVMRFYTQFKHEINEGDYLLVAGSLPDGISAEWYAKIIYEMRKTGVRVLFDAGKDVLDVGVTSSPYYIKPNEEEVKEVIPDFDFSKPRDQLRRLALNFGIENVVVTMGCQGAVGYNSVTDECVRVSSFEGFPKRIVTTGCGDAFNAGFIYGKVTRCGFRQSLIYGIAFGGANIVAGFPEKVTMPIIEARLQYVALEEVRG